MDSWFTWAQIESKLLASSRARQLFQAKYGDSSTKAYGWPFLATQYTKANCMEKSNCKGRERRKFTQAQKVIQLELISIWTKRAVKIFLHGIFDRMHSPEHDYVTFAMSENSNLMKILRRCLTLWISLAIFLPSVNHCYKGYDFIINAIIAITPLCSQWHSPLPLPFWPSLASTHSALPFVSICNAPSFMLPPRWWLLSPV